jgi:RimJ/RimL family protein N-acetyltransferase
MSPLTHPLLTPRLKLVPITPALAAAARESGQALEQAVGAEALADWSGASLNLVARSAPQDGAGRLAPAPIRALVVHREDKCIIGDVRFEPSRREDSPEIGYSIAPSRRREGYATEAAGAVVDWLFEEGGARRVVAGCDKANIASVHILRNLGFWLDGAERGAFWWFISPDLRADALGY